MKLESTLCGLWEAAGEWRTQASEPLLSARCEWSAPQSRTEVAGTEVGEFGGRSEEKTTGVTGEQEPGSEHRRVVRRRGGVGAEGGRRKPHFSQTESEIGTGGPRQTSARGQTRGSAVVGQVRAAGTACGGLWPVDAFQSPGH